MDRIKDKIKNFFEFLKKYFSLILKNAFSLVGCIYGLIGFFCFFAPIYDIFPVYFGVYEKIEFGAVFLLGLFFVAICVDVFFLRFLTNKIVYVKFKNQYHIFIHYGDVFDEKIIGKKVNKRNIVIPVNCCFDVKVDDVQISKTSLQGQAIELMKEKGIDEAEIQKRIQQSLALQKIEPETIKNADKPKGFRKRYAEGSVASVECDDDIRFLFVALVKFGRDLHSIPPSKEKFYHVFAKIMENISTNSEGYPFVLPIVGSGLSNTGLSEQDLLEFLVKSVKLYRNSFNSDVHIVVYSDKKKDVSIVSAV